jgi:hypothetical protein
MNLFLFLVSKMTSSLLLQKLSTDEGVPYTPLEGPGWLLILAAVAVLAALVFVLLKVFRGLQKSRASEADKEQADSVKTPEK